MASITQEYVAAYPIDQLTEHPRNPRRGAEAVLDESMTLHGFYGAVLVQQSTGHLIVGNHRTRVARKRGETSVPAFVVDVDDEQAQQIMLMDNHSSDLATNDDRALAALLADLQASDALLGSGYGSEDLAQLLAQLEPAELELDDMRDLGRSAEHECPFCQARWVDTATGPEPL